MRHVHDYFGDRVIQHITRADYQKFINCVGSNHSKKTVSEINHKPKWVFDLAVNDGYIAKSPAFGVDVLVLLTSSSPQS